MKVSLTIEESVPNKLYRFTQGNDYIGTVIVPILTQDILETSVGMAADAAAVARKLRELWDAINNRKYLTFVRGKFNEDNT
jgi:hypothetical protein